MFSSIFKRNLSSIAQTVQSIAEIDLNGRDFTNPYSLTPTEIKSLLWTALDLKYMSKHTEKQNLPSLESTNISLICDEADEKAQLPITLASRFLNSTISFNMVIDGRWKKNNPFICDLGQMLAMSSDIIFCKIKEQKFIEQLADGASVPVIGINSSEFSLIKTLADIMTSYEHFYRLKLLTWAWIGKPDPLFNTYLLLLPQLKMNIRYCLVDSEGHSLNFEDALKICQNYNTEMQEHWTPGEAIYRSNLICTCAHANSDYRICMKNIANASLKWGFLHKLPRGECEVERSVFIHKNSLVWKTVENLQWIYAALIVRLLRNYDHKTSEPNYDVDEFFLKN